MTSELNSLVQHSRPSKICPETLGLFSHMLRESTYQILSPFPTLQPSAFLMEFPQKFAIVPGYPISRGPIFLSSQLRRVSPSYI